MAISDRIRAEARRTIDGIQHFYEKYGNEYGDAEEKEHRIARIEAAMEGCNGLTQEEKIQKTAENVFEFVCGQERSYDALRMEIKKSRDAFGKEMESVRKDIQSGLKAISDKIEESCFDSSGGNGSKKSKDIYGLGTIAKIISKHPNWTFVSFITLLLLVFVSGHFDEVLQLFGGK